MTNAVNIAQIGSNNTTFRNKIINGACVIDQRNAGATVNTNNTFPVDRFQQQFSGAGVLTSKQSTDAPEGFTNSLEVKVTTIDASIGSTDFFQIFQAIEGFNAADIGLGQSWCKPMALSFWVKASQTGTYPVQLANTGGTRCYPTTITVNSANTWEYKTISVPATTSGTFLTDNNIGLGLRIGFVYGSNYNGATANSWGTFSTFANSFATTSNNMMSTLNATFYITGVQLEAGSAASPFEYRSYGTELALCQRYAASTFPIGTAWGQNKGASGCLIVSSPGAGVGFGVQVPFRFPVTMRTTPTTITTYNPSAANANARYLAGSSDLTTTGLPFSQNSMNSVCFTPDTAGTSVGAAIGLHISVEAEL